MTSVVSETLEPAPPKHHPGRWGLTRAGIVNVWNYYDTLFRFSGGRMILRGTNGSGKSRALEMLLPFLLDADRRKMDATGSGKVRLEDLMRHGAQGQLNRLGYLWLELGREGDEYLTIGAMVRYSASTGEAKAWYFTTPLRVGVDLRLMDDHRRPLPREQLAQLIGVERITDRPETHRETVAAQVFDLTGASGKERYAGLLQLLHTLRAPDVGDRIDEGNLPKILSDALPPLSEATLREAGERLDSLSDARDEQQRLAKAVEHLDSFLDVYRRYVARVLIESADGVKAAASEAAKLASEEDRARTKYNDLSGEHERISQELEAAKERQGRLSATIEGIKQLPAYQAGLDIENVAKRVEALGSAATSYLEAAGGKRAEETRAVERADRIADEIHAAGTQADTVLRTVRDHLTEAGVSSASLPAGIGAEPGERDEIREHVRLTLREDVQPVLRPSARSIAVTPAALDEAAATVRDVGQTAGRRAGEAANRREQAEAIEQAARELRRTEEHAEELGVRAEQDAERAEEAAADREDEARDLAVKWRHWTSDERTHAVLGDVDWARTPIAGLLLDADALVDAEADINGLDRVASEAAGAAHVAIAERRADVRQAQRADDEERKRLLSEQKDLRAQHDPEPPIVPWAQAGPAGSRPLWRSVEYVESLGATERAGLEAALLAAGLLSARVVEDGSLRAEDGQILLTTDAPAAPRPLTEVLRWDPDGGLPETILEAVLARIGFGPGHGTWVGTDGRWGNGPLRGKHHADKARFIGAAARAAAREERLKAIERELEELDERAGARVLERERIDAAEQDLNQHVRSAPTTDALRKARAAEISAAKVRARSAGDAAKASEKALRQRAELIAERRAHGELCGRLGLPTGTIALSEVMTAASEAGRDCVQLARLLASMHSGRQNHDDEITRLVTAVDERRKAESAAADSWRDWSDESARFDTLAEALGAEADEVRERLRLAEEEYSEVHSVGNRLDERERELSKGIGVAEAKVEEARRKTQTSHDGMTRAWDLLCRRVSLPGVAEAAASGNRQDLVRLCGSPTATTTQIARAAGAVHHLVDSRGQQVGESALMRAVQTITGDVTTLFDLTTDNQDGLWLIDLTDATGRQPVAVAAVRLREQSDRAAEALTGREHRVFTDFVIGGVGEELRRRLGQADGLVRAMDASLRDIRTSHGIGVRLRWELVEPQDSPIGRIRELVTESSAVRPEGHTAELIRLRKDRVDERFKEDEAVGYSEHLRTALDYRQWHRVEVSILGPEEGQVRKISRRAKLSQGETRFVSYLALFAAADAYLSGLPDTDRPLRLILLDDAFAKVDDRTIGELMGLLVRMDVDFCMTGHALWGAYPQVPSVDVYEIRRAEGTAAVATHVHWDGHARHYLRSAGHE
ncbi:TIGR02680 family protein [Amycolatopsis azurea]|uniref:TIGR02680 family protein n=1 Tax=Amycolatopsis azurea TaxID=36819 RepID=UPI00381EAE40